MNCPFQRAFIFLRLCLCHPQIAGCLLLFRVLIFLFCHLWFCSWLSLNLRWTQWAILNLLVLCPCWLQTSFFFAHILLLLPEHFHWCFLATGLTGGPFHMTLALPRSLSDLCCQMPSGSRRSSWRSFYPFILLSLLWVLGLKSAVRYFCFF